MEKVFFKKKSVMITISIVILIILIGWTWFYSKNGYDLHNRTFLQNAARLDSLFVDLIGSENKNSIEPGKAWEYARLYDEKHHILNSQAEALAQGKGNIIFFTKQSKEKGEHYLLKLENWKRLNEEIKVSRNDLSGFIEQSEDIIKSVVSFRVSLANGINDQTEYNQLRDIYEQLSPKIQILENGNKQENATVQNPKDKSIAAKIQNGYHQINDDQRSILSEAQNQLKGAADFLQTYSKNLRSTLVESQTIIGGLSLFAEKLAPWVNQAAGGLSRLTSEMNQYRSAIDLAARMDPNIGAAVQFIDKLESTVSHVQSEIHSIQNQVTPFRALIIQYNQNPSREIQEKVVAESRTVSGYFSNRVSVFDPVLSALDKGKEYLERMARYRGSESSGNNVGGRMGAVLNRGRQMIARANPLPSLAQTGIQILDTCQEPFNRGKETIRSLSEELGNIGSSEERYRQKLKDIRNVLTKETTPLDIHYPESSADCSEFPGADWGLFALGASGMILLALVPFIIVKIKRRRYRYPRPVAIDLHIKENDNHPKIEGQFKKITGEKYIEFFSGDFKGQKIDLSEKMSALTIGRDPREANLVCSDTSISRKHFILRFNTAISSLTVEDLDSRFGTRVNGKALKPNVAVQLQNGDCVAAGQGDVCSFMYIDPRDDGKSVKKTISLLGLSGPLSGQKLILIENQRFVLGRDPMHSKVIIDHPLISRRHVSLEVINGGVWVEDLNSRHGVLIDNVRLESGGKRFVHKDGQQMCLGDNGICFIFQIEAETYN